MLLLLDDDGVDVADDGVAMVVDVAAVDATAAAAAAAAAAAHLQSYTTPTMQHTNTEKCFARSHFSHRNR